MQFYGKAEQAANRILSLFQSGDVPKALSPIFINRHDENTPCRKWSWSNQLLTALAGHDDARGFRQWEEVGRHVKKGEHGFPILVPLHYKRESKDDETGEVSTKTVLVGFKCQIVFGYDQTDGKPLPYREDEKTFLESLPLIEVAKSWGISVNTYNGKDAKYYGYFRYGSEKGHIAIGVENVVAWCHELVHCADYRLGNLKGLKRTNQHWQPEIVAQLGAATLLYCLGFERDADPGFTWQYVQAYANKHKVAPIRACQSLIQRVCTAVNSILEGYERINSQESGKAVA